MVTDRLPGVGAASKVWRLLATVGVFGLVGPPVGGLVTWVTMGSSALRSPMPFLTGSYGEGIALALAAGMLIGVAALWLGSAPWPVPVVVVVVVNMAMLATTFFADPPSADLVASMVRIGRVFLPASLVATVVCWLLTRPLLRFV